MVEVINAIIDVIAAPWLDPIGDDNM